MLSSALCAMRYALCAMRYALCAMGYGKAGLAPSAQDWSLRGFDSWLVWF